MGPKCESLFFFPESSLVLDFTLHHIHQKYSYRGGRHEPCAFLALGYSATAAVGGNKMFFALSSTFYVVTIYS
jgi:hypothetical protein